MRRCHGLVVHTLLLLATACGSADQSETGAGSTRALDVTLSREGITFEVQCANKHSLNELHVIPSGLEIVNRPQRIEVDGIAHHAEVADLNADGSPELYVFVTSVGSGSYGSVAAWAANNRKSLSQIYMPELDPSSDEAEGYMGHDRFSLSDSSLVRTFPVYRDGDTNANPTGGTRRLEYELVAGEASWILQQRSNSD